MIIMKIPDNTKIQSVDIKVNDLGRSLEFYNEFIGLKIVETAGKSVYLSANGGNPYLLGLHEDRDAVKEPRGTTGLFHTAIRLPNRKELARVFLRLFERKVKFQGFSDHIVSEAIYLADPEGNGLELYADRPRAEWKYKMGQVEMDTLPLNLNVITDELDDRDVWNGIHEDTDIGHIHLKVSDLHKAQEIYSMVLGFNITNSIYPGALFFGAGGYHHHIGANTWFTKNGKPASDNSAGLTGFTINMPDEKYLETVKSRAEESGIEIVPGTENGFTILDFDKNKIKLIL
jgi:catechol 2,3-dioxygenase